MTTFAKLAKYMANRKSKYEKLQDSPLESQKNTARLMMERIDKKTEELFQTQESLKNLKNDFSGRHDDIPLARWGGENEENEEVPYYGNWTRYGTPVKVSEKRGPVSRRAFDALEGLKTRTATNYAPAPDLKTDDAPFNFQHFPPSDVTPWGTKANITYGEPVGNQQAYLNSLNVNNNFTHQIRNSAAVENQPAVVNNQPSIDNSTAVVESRIPVTRPNIRPLNAPNPFIPSGLKPRNLEELKTSLGIELNETPGDGPEEILKEAAEQIIPGKDNKWKKLFTGKNGKALSELAGSLGPALGEFAVGQNAIRRMQAPNEPIYSPAVSLNKSYDSSADENNIRRMTRSRILNATRNAPNSQAALAEISKSHVDATNAYNNLNQQKNNFRAQMENAEAGMNFQNNMVNNQMANTHMDRTNRFNNNKVSATAGTYTRLMDKIAMSGLEKRQRKHDLSKAEILIAQFPEEMRGELKELIKKFGQ